MNKLMGWIVAAVLLIGVAESASKENVCRHKSHIVGWTKWFDRDDPTLIGDYETLSSLRLENPKKICEKPFEIEARTVSGVSVSKAKQKIATYDTVTGFICKNEDQSDKQCKDYKVRFSCPPTSCSKKYCWTQYFSRDLPTGTGDWETLSALRKKYRKKICKVPKYIQAVTKGSETPADETGQKFYRYSPTNGFVCRNKDQPHGKKCKNYKVRFACPCK